MTKSEFLRQLEGQMEIPEGTLNEHQALSDIEEWDSLAALLFIALADEKLGMTVAGNDIANSKKMSDLLALLGDRLTA